MTEVTVNLTPHLFFGGNCREAMEFYKQVFGGELTLAPYSEGPADAHKDPKANSEEMKAKIMYAKLSGDISLMASDNPHNTDDKNTGQFGLSLDGADEVTLTSYFEKLSEKGQITAPLVKQFWGDTFGMVTDQFGITWMVNIPASNH
ncbi:VOC family protein [Spirosoma sp. KNUC1025]|uniref:VOC family protein n=1 Tax=Spirosoma sp. KNUC1025 TaxID=2894082 RepID=UPI003868DB2F|nr:VOC family protein [Spirosoma sp. KNUC1025]